MAWLENRVLEKNLRWWLVSLAACGTLLACKEEQKPADDRRDQGTSGQGAGGSGVGGALSAAGTSGISGSPAGGSRAEEVKGERGSSCDSSRDCEADLSCIVTANCPAGVACANKTCQPSNFEILGTGKQCHIVDCATRKDCCGDMPLEAPKKCDVREIRCSRPMLAGCTAITCQEDDQCGAGKCAGLCAYDSSPTATVSCQTVDECEENVCVFPGGTGGAAGTAGTGGAAGGGTGGTGGTGSVIGKCSLTNTSCLSDNNCVKNSCSARSCRCQNPEYDPTDPICEDEDCEGICGWTCENERCVADKSCRVDSECASTQPFCDDGKCVECKNAEDCEDEPCIAGRCGPECKVDTQCGQFEVCRENECVYVGCQTDRECILSARAQASDQDPRLAVCRKDQAGVGTCVFPCEIDAQCAVTQICVDTVCQYIGCETDTECKTIAGVHNQPPPSDEHPWTTTAECRAEPGN